MSPPADLEPWLRLTLVPGLGNSALRKLLTEFGSPESVLAAGRGALGRHLEADVAAAIADGGNTDGAAHALAWLDDPANHILTLADADYPRQLLELPDPPPLLYVKGRHELLQQPALAIVGSRNATAQGIANAEEFARALSDAGLVIISGLALGIDAAAHRGGLAGAAGTIAVVGTGLDIVYPARNRDLAHEIATRGALVSEFALGTPALGSNFPRRNRVISGLARGCLVIEAALQSGSLITARLANEQGREVFAIPGSIHSPLSKGCHRLIKQGAKLVDDANDILEELRLPTAAAPPAAEGIASSSGPQAEKLLEQLGFDPCSLDTLCARSGLAADAATALLLELELQNRVQMLPGGFYQRVR
ncbi:MAG TPA: DNA-processing protein DprA [Burkholderiales bacterium]|nr:DNA-processing protein DprA [Burkholderiales bacterium]